MAILLKENGKMLKKENEIKKNIQKKLEESKNKYRFLVENLNEGIWFIDKDNLISFVNNNTVKMLGYERFEIIGKKLTDFICEEESISAIKDKNELCFYKKDGSKIETTIIYSNLYDKEQNYNGSIVAIQDISEKTKLEKESGKLHKQLDQAHKLESIGSLASGIAHEFNNVLAAIQGYTELTLRSLENKDHIKENLEVIHMASLRATDLSRQILNFSRSDENEFSEIDPIPSIKQTVKLLQQTIPKNYEIDLDYENCKGRIKINVTELFQIAINLGMNAYHSMIKKEKGKILFSAKSQKTTQILNIDEQKKCETDTVFVFSVKDTGSGITKEDMDKIFEPFFTTKEKGKGTGLGLSLIKEIISKNQGFVKVNSILGKCSEFKIIFPLLKKSFPKGTYVPENDNFTKKKNKNIMLVDDEKMITKLYQRFLSNEGHKVYSFNRSEEALSYFQENSVNIDLVITDMAMPDLTGATLSSELLKIKPKLSILMITGYSEQFSEEQALKLGIRDYKLKPIELQELADLIQRY